MKSFFAALIIILISGISYAGDSGKNTPLFINTLDTVVFDLSQASCTGPYLDVPFSIVSDDVVDAIDFSMKFDLAKINFNSLVSPKAYLFPAAIYSSADNILRFTAFSLQPIEHNTSLGFLRFNLLSSPIQASDFNTINTYLNGDKCSYKVIDTPLSSVSISAGGPTTFSAGDSIALSATAGLNYLYSWSTGETTQSVYVKNTGIYSVTITNDQGCSVTTSINVLVSSSLPVELIDFSAKGNSNGILLSWITASEINNDYFTIERSSNAIQWEEIMKINGFGNSTSLRNYSLLDRDPLNGINYYKLKQTDYDGSFSYSKIAMQHFQAHKGMALNMSVYPNPASEILNVAVSEDATVVLLNMEGIPVMAHEKVNANQKRGINLANITNGIYCLKIYNESVVSTRNVVISK